MTSAEYCKIAVKALEDKKAEDEAAQKDVEKESEADGMNQNQIQAMRDAVDEALYKADLKVRQVEGNQSSTWILMDYNDIIIHIFSKEDRLFYDLERIWKDGKEISVDEL